jgi:hypothetical protein
VPPLISGSLTPLKTPHVALGIPLPSALAFCGHRVRAFAETGRSIL